MYVYTIIALAHTNDEFHCVMASTWGFVLFVGLASSAIALDVSYIADKVIASMNATLAAHNASQWFSLPGFNISFNNQNESRWRFHYGELASIGGIEKYTEPEITHFAPGSDSVVIPININDLVVDYKFSCSDFFSISGSSYSISRTVSTQANIIVDIIYGSSSQCYGEVHSTPSSFSYEEDGSDFSKITPDDQYAKQCIIRSYTRRQDYADRINEIFEEDYGKAVEKVLSTVAQLALSGLNLCSQ